jgi:predicted CxxxxCH...CXXCH cytochrome family protein
MAGGHGADWMDQTSSGFHAYAADQNLASCQACHGTTLDGVGGTVALSCAQCHGGQWKTSCTMCHGGTDSQSGAPPRTVWGQSGDAVRVGAHTAHLAGTHGLGAVTCSSCHVVPQDALAAGHANGATADVTFSGLASLGTASAPTWTRASGTCANTYCHGATLSGGTLKSPSWTQTDGSPRACGACHGAPPPAPHTTSTSCGSCHAGYTATSVNLALHMNGTLDVTSSHPAGWSAKEQHGYTVNRSGLATCKTCHGAALDGVGGTAQGCAGCHTTAGIASWATSCTFCHGDRTSGRASPPVDTQGGTVVTNTSVGVHGAHLGTALMTGMSCAQCHPDRTGSNVITDAAHIDGDGIAEVTFGALAKTGGAAAVYTRTSATQATCASTWCHGAFSGGANATMSWTTPGTLGCASCHGAPPPAPHTTSTACGTCHAGYTATSVNPATHLNGVVDVVNMTCTSCHGQAGQAATAASPLKAAPPVDTAGATTGLKVGAHQRHLVAGTYSNPLPCQTCHAQVASYTTSHANGTADVGFTGAAAVNLQKGTWTASSGTTAGSCSATWCHGAVIGETGGTAGGTLTAPRWTDAITGCTSCHGAPPPAPHPTSTTCGSCHAGYTATSVNLATHLNGVVDVANMTCTSCHGQAGQTATAASPLYAAPPVDTAGATTGIKVGAHQKHLSGGTYSNGFACQTCHASVATYTTSHANGKADVGFTGAASANLQKGTWTASSGTTAGSCSATWCHGAVINRSGGTSGGTATVPSWTGSVTTCTVCHSVTMSTLPNNHTRSNHNVGCQVCHGPGYSTTAVNKATHVDGTKTIVTVTSGTGIRSWNATTRSCQPSCHGTETW